MQNTATITICVWKLKLLRMETLLSWWFDGLTYITFAAFVLASIETIRLIFKFCICPFGTTTLYQFCWVHGVFSFLILHYCGPGTLLRPAITYFWSLDQMVKSNGEVPLNCITWKFDSINLDWPCFLFIFYCHLLNAPFMISLATHFFSSLYT